MALAMAARAALTMEAASPCSSVAAIQNPRGFASPALRTLPSSHPSQRIRVLSLRSGCKDSPVLSVRLSSNPLFCSDTASSAFRRLRFSHLDCVPERRLLHARASTADGGAVAGEGFANAKSEVVVNDGSGAGDSSLAQTLQLGSLFGLWYLFNIYFNIYNKQVLKAFPFPVTITHFQFAVGSVLVLLMWGSGIQKRPALTKAQVLSILPLGIVHTLGNLFTNMSLGKVAVSFTHTIKAMEPFFSVVLSAMFLGEMISVWCFS